MNEHCCCGCPVAVLFQRTDAQRVASNVLEARIADQDGVIASLKRQIDELRHIVLDVQRAHNVLAAHTPPNVDLLP